MFITAKTETDDHTGAPRISFGVGGGGRKKKASNGRKKEHFGRERRRGLCGRGPNVGKEV